MFMFIEPPTVWPMEPPVASPISAGRFIGRSVSSPSMNKMHGLLSGPVVPILQHLARQWGWTYRQTGQAFGMPRIAVMGEVHAVQMASAMNAQMRGTAYVVMNPRAKTIVLHFGLPGAPMKKSVSNIPSPVTPSVTEKRSLPSPICTAPESRSALQTGYRKPLPSTLSRRIRVSPMALRSVLQKITLATGHDIRVSSLIPDGQIPGYFPWDTPASALIFLHLLHRHEGLVVTMNPRTEVITILHKQELPTEQMPDHMKEIF